MNYEELLAEIKKDKASAAIMLVVLAERGAFNSQRHSFFISVAQQVAQKALKSKHYSNSICFEDLLTDKQFEAVSRSLGMFFRKYCDLALEKQNA